ncbi:unnamed protein product [Brassica rapa subsp. trilocularis]
MGLGATRKTKCSMGVFQLARSDVYDPEPRSPNRPARIEGLRRTDTRCMKNSSLDSTFSARATTSTEETANPRAPVNAADDGDAATISGGSDEPQQPPLMKLELELEEDEANAFWFKHCVSKRRPASRSTSGMTRHEVTCLHLQERTADLKGKTIGKFQPNPKNADPSCNLLITRLASIPERRLPPA